MVSIVVQAPDRVQFTWSYLLHLRIDCALNGIDSIVQLGWSDLLASTTDALIVNCRVDVLEWEILVKLVNFE